MSKKLYTFLKQDLIYYAFLLRENVSVSVKYPKIIIKKITFCSIKAEKLKQQDFLSIAVIGFIHITDM